MHLTLSNQENIKVQIAPKFLQIEGELNKRRKLWDRLPTEKKISWVKSGKDPILSIAFDFYKHLNSFFGDTNDI